jgi:hypothetical protein
MASLRQATQAVNTWRRVALRPLQHGSLPPWLSGAEQPDNFDFLPIASVIALSRC